MQQEITLFKNYSTAENPELLKINRREILRYAGMAGMKEDEIDDKLNAILDECIKEAMPLLTYKVSYRYEKLSNVDGHAILPFEYTFSNALDKNLKNCNEVVLFAATVGIALDRLIAKYNKVSKVKGLFLQAFGAERIEALCDLFNEEVRAEALGRGKITKPRFSPGYGDLSLEIQKPFTEILDCSRRLGINLNESLLMSPSKSVTALIGIMDNEGSDNDGCASDIEIKQDCSNCDSKNCEFRK